MYALYLKARIFIYIAPISMGDPLINATASPTDRNSKLIVIASCCRFAFCSFQDSFSQLRRFIKFMQDSRSSLRVLRHESPFGGDAAIPGMIPGAPDLHGKQEGKEEKFRTKREEEKEDSCLLLQRLHNHSFFQSSLPSVFPAMLARPPTPHTPKLSVSSPSPLGPSLQQNNAPPPFLTLASPDLPFCSADSPRTSSSESTPERVS